MTGAETLLAHALAALDAGDLAIAIERFERAARASEPARPSDAVHALDAAARVALMCGDHARAAGLANRARELAARAPGAATAASRLVLTAEVADRGGDRTVRRTAWESVVQGDDAPSRYRALLRLAELARDDGEHALAALHLTTALAELPTPATAIARGELLLELSSARMAAGDSSGAERALAQAAALPADGPTTDPLDGDSMALLGARIAGQRSAIAFEAGDLEAALALATTARDAAVAHDDALTYLGASTVIAAVHERADRLVDAYDTYIRARESLAQLLGDGGRQLVGPAIELFERRLGPARFAATWNAWVAQRK
ncbi:MAG: hypothetical protein NT062_24145 [Proteobacteria bacterium]|nr:hypothetical protein [Pseudomonadota bacterium]